MAYQNLGMKQHTNGNTIGFSHIEYLQANMPEYTLILVEDDAEARQRLSNIITEHDDFELLCAATTVAEGKEALKTFKPDILLTDLGLPDGSGIEIIKAISELNLDCEAMVISGFQDEHNVFQALEAGAKAYLLKHDDSHEIGAAIVAMTKGGAPISPIIARLMLQKFHRQPLETAALPEELTERQSKILKLISQGFSSREISEKLNVSYYTVTTHIKNIYNKLQVNSRTEALHEAGKLGLLP